ncbi:hypothetical protein [Halostella sp. PRR32]|uniref:hypothetical protein n=1 Tax=Halostella sp. PRR32 TaxID=3098147 RepID=UPI002B1E53F6|nr:hypothetical protein [Halostella sp. PRR32]
MSQQPLPQTGAQTGQMTGTMGQQGQQGVQAQLVQQTGQNFEADLTGELRTALEDFETVTDVTQWCVDKMIEKGPQMATCIRVCQDIGELADLNARMIARDSIYGLEAAMLFASVAEDGLQEIKRHQNPHCQETVAVVNRALDSTYQLLESFGQPQLIQQVEQQLHQAHEQFEQMQVQPPSAQGMQGGEMGQPIGQQGQMGQQPQQQMSRQPPQQMGQQGGQMQQPQQW